MRKRDNVMKSPRRNRHYVDADSPITTDSEHEIEKVMDCIAFPEQHFYRNDRDRALRGGPNVFEKTMDVAAFPENQIKRGSPNDDESSNAGCTPFIEEHFQCSPLDSERHPNGPNIFETTLDAIAFPEVHLQLAAKSVERTIESVSIPAKLVVCGDQNDEENFGAGCAAFAEEHFQCSPLDSERHPDGPNIFEKTLDTLAFPETFTEEHQLCSPLNSERNAHRLNIYEKTMDAVAFAEAFTEENLQCSPIEAERNPEGPNLIEKTLDTVAFPEKLVTNVATSLENFFAYATKFFMSPLPKISKAEARGDSNERQDDIIESRSLPEDTEKEGYATRRRPSMLQGVDKDEGNSNPNRKQFEETSTEANSIDEQLNKRILKLIDHQDSDYEEMPKASKNLEPKSTIYRIYNRKKELIEEVRKEGKNTRIIKAKGSKENVSEDEKKIIEADTRQEREEALPEANASSSRDINYRENSLIEPGMFAKERIRSEMSFGVRSEYSIVTRSVASAVVQKYMVKGGKDKYYTNWDDNSIVSRQKVSSEDFLHKPYSVQRDASIISEISSISNQPVAFAADGPTELTLGRTWEESKKSRRISRFLSRMFASKKKKQAKKQILRPKAISENKPKDL